MKLLDIKPNHHVFSVLRHSQDAFIILMSLAAGFLPFLQNTQRQRSDDGAVIGVKALNVTALRDAVSLSSITITCTNSSGTPLTGAPVSVSLSSPGVIVSPASGFGTTDSHGNMSVQVRSKDKNVNNATATLTAVSNYVVSNSSVTFQGMRLSSLVPQTALLRVNHPTVDHDDGTPNAGTAIRIATHPVLVHRCSFTRLGGDPTLHSSPSGSDASNGILVGGATVVLSNNARRAAPGLITNGTIGQGAQLPVSAFYNVHSSFTVEQWFMRTDASSGYQTLFSCSTDTLHYLIARPAREDGGQLSVDFNSGHGEVSLRAPAPARGRETLLTVTYDAVTKQAYLYLNGVQVNTLPVPDGFDLSQAASNTNSGINGLSPFGGASFNGVTKEFRLYRGALTPSEVHRQFQAGPNKLGSL